MPHWKQVFNNPYLASEDLEGPIIVTIKLVKQEADKTSRTKDKFNTAYFTEKEIYPGEPLKPMILNRSNCRTLQKLTGERDINKWKNVKVKIYVDETAKYQGVEVGGLRIDVNPVVVELPELLQGTPAWSNAIVAYRRDGNFDAIEKRMRISAANKKQIKADAAKVDEAEKAMNTEEGKQGKE